MPYSVKERVRVVEAYVRTGSFKETREIFREQFADASIPAKSTVQDLIAKWRAIGSVLKAFCSDSGSDCKYSAENFSKPKQI
jgi:hypothetical protein